MTAFLNITGQVIYSKIMEAYTQEAFVVSKLVDTIPTRLDGEKIPGISRVTDTIDEVGPGMPYPHLGFGEDYIETPSTTKRGFIVPVTKEAIFFDRTHLVLSRAAEVGEVLGLNKEKRLIDLVIGATNNYKWKGTTYNTYQTSTPWINSLATNELVDWTNVDAAEQLFADILDPNTGEPVLVRGTTVLVMPAYRHAAHRVFNGRRAHVHGRRFDDGHGGGQSADRLPRVRKPAGLSADHRRRASLRRRQEVVVRRRFPPGVCLHGELADHGHAGAAGQRGRVQQRHRGAVQSQRARGGGRDQSAVRREEHGLM